MNMNRMARVVGTCLALIVSITTAFAQSPSREAYHFLNLPATAEAAAVGGKSVSLISTNPGLVFDNPGLYGQESTGRLYLSYMNHMLSSHAGNVFYGQSSGDRGAWGIGVRFMQYGKMEGFDEHGVPLGSFSSSDIAVQGTYSYDLSYYFRGGVSLKALYSNIEQYNSFGLGVDVGITYHDDVNGTSLGAVVKNVGAQIKGYHNEREMLAWDFAIGYSQRLAHAPFKLHLLAHGLNPHYINSSHPDLKVGEKILRHFNVGLEFCPTESFWLALGYNPGLGQDLKLEGGSKLGGLSLGAGFNTSKLAIGLSAASYHPSALSLMVTLSMNIGPGGYSL